MKYLYECIYLAVSLSLQLVGNLTSDDYVSSIKGKINDSFTQDVNYYGPSFEFNDAGTAHLSVVAPDGSAVAITATINN